MKISFDIHKGSMQTKCVPDAEWLLAPFKSFIGFPRKSLWEANFLRPDFGLHETNDSREGQRRLNDGAASEVVDGWLASSRLFPGLLFDCLPAARDVPTLPDAELHPIRFCSMPGGPRGVGGS